MRNLKRSDSMLAVTASIIFGFTGILSACAEQPNANVMIAFATPPTPKVKLEQQKRVILGFLETLDNANLTLLPITSRTTNDNLSDTLVFKHQWFDGFDEMFNQIKTITSKSERVSKITKVLTHPGTINGSKFTHDLIGALKVAEANFQNQPGSKTLIILSTGFHQTAQRNLFDPTKINSSAYRAKLIENIDLRLPGVRLCMLGMNAGNDPKYPSSVKTTDAIEQFWRALIAKADGTMITYGQHLEKLDVCFKN